MGAMIAPTTSSGLTPPWVRHSGRKAYLPCQEPVDLCRLSDQSPPSDSGPKPWQRNALLGLVALGGCLYLGGVAAEAMFPIQPEPSQVTLAERQAYTAECQAQMGQLSSNSEQIERLARLADRLEPFQSQPTEFTLVDNQKVNAYSCGLGKIMIEERLASLLTDDELLYVIVRDRRGREPVPGAVGTLMSNLGLEQALGRLGVRFERAKVGDRYVLELLQQNGWRYGGESSGHLLCLDCHTTGDGTISALQVLSAMRASGATLAELCADLTLFPQKLVNVRIERGFDWQASVPLARAREEVERELGDGGRILIRPSGTEPLLRLMVEAHEAGVAERMAQRLADAVAQR